MNNGAFLSEITKIRDRVLVMLIVNHGMKAHELAELTTNDIDYQNKKIFVKQSCGAITRVVPLSNGSIDTLAAYMRVRSPSMDRKVFLVEEGDYRGQPQSAQGILERIECYF